MQDSSRACVLTCCAIFLNRSQSLALSGCCEHLLSRYFPHTNTPFRKHQHSCTVQDTGAQECKSLPSIHSSAEKATLGPLKLHANISSRPQPEDFHPPSSSLLTATQSHRDQQNDTPLPNSPRRPKHCKFEQAQMKKKRGKWKPSKRVPLPAFMSPSERPDIAKTTQGRGNNHCWNHTAPWKDQACTLIMMSFPQEPVPEGCSWAMHSYMLGQQFFLVCSSCILFRSSTSSGTSLQRPFKSKQ